MYIKIRLSFIIKTNQCAEQTKYTIQWTDRIQKHRSNHMHHFRRSPKTTFLASIQMMTRESMNHVFTIIHETFSVGVYTVETCKRRIEFGCDCMIVLPSGIHVLYSWSSIQRNATKKCAVNSVKWKKKMLWCWWI